MIRNIKKIKKNDRANDNKNYHKDKMQVVKFEMYNRDNYYGDFDEYIYNANVVWIKYYKTKYTRKEVGASNIIIGYDITNHPICCAMIDIIADTAFISRMASIYQKIGNGTVLLNNILTKLKYNDITKISLNIKKNENREYLEKYYGKFGFNGDICNYYYDYDGYKEIQKYLIL